MQLSWDGSDIDEKTIVAMKDEEFDVSVTAKLLNDVSHVDNVLFIIEGDDLDKFDAESVEVSPQKLGDGNGYLYWGPLGNNGFCFDSKEPVTTAFKITCNTAGTYNVNIYAVQLPPAAN